MYICLCHGVSDSDIREAAREGARSLGDLSAMTGCASSCGACAGLAESLIAETAGLAEPAARARPLMAA